MQGPINEQPRGVTPGPMPLFSGVSTASRRPRGHRTLPETGARSEGAPCGSELLGRGVERSIEADGLGRGEPAAAADDVVVTPADGAVVGRGPAPVRPSEDTASREGTMGRIQQHGTQPTTSVPVSRTPPQPSHSQESGNREPDGMGRGPKAITPQLDPLVPSYSSIHLPRLPRAEGPLVDQAVAPWGKHAPPPGRHV